MIKNKQINIKNTSNYTQTSRTDTPIINKQLFLYWYCMKITPKWGNFTIYSISYPNYPRWGSCGVRKCDNSLGLCWTTLGQTLPWCMLGSSIHWKMSIFSFLFSMTGGQGVSKTSDFAYIIIKMHRYHKKCGKIKLVPQAPHCGNKCGNHVCFLSQAHLSD